jgi:hypothetical protein
MVAFERVGTTITYKQNGLIYYTSLLSSSGIVLIDIALYENNSTITDAIFDGVTFIESIGGIDSYTKLMLHCNGADMSTTFTDDSFSARTVTANDNAQINTAQYKFGLASGIFDGSGDFLSIVNSSDFNFNSNDFTIDF